MHDNNERLPSTTHEESIGLENQNDLSDCGTDYDSSVEDPNERHDRFLSSNKKN